MHLLKVVLVLLRSRSYWINCALRNFIYIINIIIIIFVFIEENVDCKGWKILKVWDRAVFKRLSKVITRLPRLLIGPRISRQFYNLWEAKLKLIAPCTPYFSRALSNLLFIARNSDWFITVFAPSVIGRSNHFGIGSSTVIWKLL